MPILDFRLPILDFLVHASTPLDASPLKSGNPPTRLTPLCRESRSPQWLSLVGETNPKSKIRNPQAP
ncbi:hypothetical protein [Nostoc sp.]